MCKECGCPEEVNDEGHYHDGVFHRHGYGGHGHSHHDSATEHMKSPASRTLTIEQKILFRNDDQAAKNRAYLAANRVIAVNIISSPGSGKTLLLERTLDRLNGRIKCAVIVGDQQTDNDARRLTGKGAEVRQIETLSACHLDAAKISHLLPEVITGGVKILFIENVGNLVCPAAFDLGENFKIALLSVTEGEDKPIKYPALFTMVPLAVLTKTDLIPHLDWNLDKCLGYLRQINPDVTILELSAKTGHGMNAWIEYLENLAG